MRPSKAAVVIGLTASLAACARPGNTPAGTPTAESRTVTLQASAAPAQHSGIAVAPSRVVARPAPPCAVRAAQPPKPATTPGPRPGGQPKPAEPKARQPQAAQPGTRLPEATEPEATGSEAAARARKALEAANTPVPRRGVVSLGAVAIAESCAQTLRLELTLLTAGQAGRPDESALRRTLTAMGLSGITIGKESDFAASTGSACVYGTFTPKGPELSIGPLTPHGTCRP